MTRPCPDCKSPARGNPCWYFEDHPEEAIRGDPPCVEYDYIEDADRSKRRFRRRFWKAVAVLFFVIVVLVIYSLSTKRAPAQEHHERHHATYQNWVNGKDGGCCNDQDCGELASDNERETAAGVEVRIDGEWCPVHAWHYLKRGNAPNWATSHICVTRNYSGLKTSACDRLLCYQPKPGI